MNIEIIYDHNCPNVEAARKKLREVLVSLEMKEEWLEWERADSRAPLYVRQYSSPTILVNGQDIDQSPGTEGDACRIYFDDQGRVERVPTIDQIQSAILREREKSVIPHRHALLSVPIAILASLPPLLCPLCWPAYAAFLSSMGLGFINYTAYLMPLIILLLSAVLISLWIDIRRHHNYLPFLMATFSGIFILLGKFLLNSDFFLYFGITGVIFASLYNISPFARMGLNRR